MTQALLTPRAHNNEAGHSEASNPATTGDQMPTLNAVFNLDPQSFRMAAAQELSGSYLGKVAATCQTTNIEMD